MYKKEYKKILTRGHFLYCNSQSKAASPSFPRGTGWPDNWDFRAERMGTGKKVLKGFSCVTLNKIKCPLSQQLFIYLVMF